MPYFSLYDSNVLTIKKVSRQIVCRLTLQNNQTTLFNYFLCVVFLINGSFYYIYAFRQLI